MAAIIQVIKPWVLPTASNLTCTNMLNTPFVTYLCFTVTIIIHFWQVIILFWQVRVSIPGVPHPTSVDVNTDTRSDTAATYFPGV